MSFFVVQRGGDSALSVPLPEVFPTREAALRALSEAASSGSLVLDGEVFIADLSGAVPVLVIMPQAQDAVAEGEQAEPAEPELTVAEELSVEVAEEAWSPLTTLGDEDSLAAALKRAASSLEDEGIVAPASIESAPEGEDTAAEAETADEAPVGGSWPWANVEAYEGSDESAAQAETPEPTEDVEPPEALQEPEDFEVDEPAPVETVAEPLGVSIAEEGEDDGDGDLSDELYGLTGADSLVEDSPIITGAPGDGEEAYLPRPVILGDYTQTSTPILGEDDALAEGPAPIFESVVADTLQELPSPEPSPVVEGGYEAGGELDLENYTCQDCVYSNTCPKVGQATPADCGSFQWRAE